MADGATTKKPSSGTEHSSSLLQRTVQQVSDHAREIALISQSLKTIEQRQHGTDLKLDAVLTAVTEFGSEAKHRPVPVPVTHYVYVVGACMAILVSILGGISWWFNASFDQAAKAIATNSEVSAEFARTLTKEGRYFILEDRVRRLESAIVWDPKLNQPK